MASTHNLASGDSHASSIAEDPSKNCGGDDDFVQVNANSPLQSPGPPTSDRDTIVIEDSPEDGNSSASSSKPKTDASALPLAGASGVAAYDDEGVMLESLRRTTTVDVVVSQTTETIVISDDDDDEDEEEEVDPDFAPETLTERLWGLTEMFPEPVVNGVSSTVSGVVRKTPGALNWVKNAGYRVTATFMIFIFPAMVSQEMERFYLEQAASTKRMLLGPGVGDVVSTAKDMIPTALPSSS